MRKVLVVGSVPPPCHGQAMCVQKVIDSLLDCKLKVVNTSFQSNNICHSFLKAAEYFFEVLCALIIFRPDTVYFVCSRTRIGMIRDLYLLLFCFVFRLRVINHLHGSDFNEFYESLSDFNKLIVRKLYSAVEKHAVLIDGMQGELIKVAKLSNVVVIPNFFIEDEIINQLSTKKSNKGLNVFYLSSIVVSKGVFDIIEAVKLCQSNGIDINLTIAGDFLGCDLMSKSQVEILFNNAISGFQYINYLGVVDVKEKYRVLAKSHVFALPSYYPSEAIPLSVIEAMRMGCAILTTRYKYLPSLVRNHVNGVLVDIKSPDQIANNLISLFQDRVLLDQISKNNIDLAKNEFSEKKYRDNVRNFILSK